MAGLVPAIHDLPRGTKNVDTRDKPGHDDLPCRDLRSPHGKGEEALHHRL